MFDVIDAETGKYIVTPGIREDEPIRSYPTIDSAVNSHVSSFNLSLKSILTFARLDGNLDVSIKHHFKTMNNPVDVVYEDKQIVKSFKEKEFLSTQDSIESIRSYLGSNYQFVEDYVIGRELSDRYADVVISKDQTKYSEIKKICKDRFWNFDYRDDNLIASIGFKDEDDLVLWRMACPFDIKEFVQFSVYDLVYKMNRLEEMVDYSLRGK